MGIWNAITGEFIDVIEWLDRSGDILVWRFPDNDNAIKMGAKLTVRETQTAVFVNEGRIADVYGPGLYSLSTQNMPIMTKLQSWKYGFESPFKAEIYFVNMRRFLDLKWGTRNPITARDPELGVVRLRAFGTYGIRVTDPGLFVKEIVGTLGLFTTEAIEDQLRSLLVSSFTTMLGAAEIPALDLAAKYRALGDEARDRLDRDFQAIGLSLDMFIIENISLPPEVEKMLDVKSQMGIVGDFDRLTRFQTAQAIPEAAKAGGAGEMMGMGAGLAIGQQMGAAMAANLNQPQKTPAAGSVQTDNSGKFCAQCGTIAADGAKFCTDCGKPFAGNCPQCGKPTASSANFCSECGVKL